MRPDKASFRDPSGQVFHANGKVLRAVHLSYQRHYDYLLASSLYSDLTEQGWLIPHQEIPAEDTAADVFKTITPELISLISYPQEWTFSQLKQAALLTLRIQIASLEKGMILKDASPYNVQFTGTEAIWIDTLSFEILRENMPWNAYRQFCEQYLLPLIIMAKKDIGLNLLKVYPAGVPLGIGVRLLPFLTKMQPVVWTNMVLHERLQRKHQGRADTSGRKRGKISKEALMGHAMMLLRYIEKLRPAKSRAGGWQHYYQEAHPEAYLKEKESALRSVLEVSSPKEIYDLGANTGMYTRMCAEFADRVFAVESDPVTADILFRGLMKERSKAVQVLQIDLTEPAPPSGWAGEERPPLWMRKKADMVVALALVHHLAIGCNVPYGMIASFLHKMGDELLLEYVSPADPYAQRMMHNKENLRDRLSPEAFLKAFESSWQIVSTYPLSGGFRTLYHFKKKHIENS